MKNSPLAAAIALLSSGLLLAQSQPAQNQDQGSQGQVPPAAQSGQPGRQQTNQPVTGKTGNEATHIDTTTTGSAGQETPGVQTNLGVEQQPGKHEDTRHPNSPNPTPTERPGAPPNWEQVGQTPQSADTGASAASRAEVGGSGGGTLGVNATPQYDQTSNGQQQPKASGTKTKSKKSQKAKQPGQQPSQQAQPPK